MTSLCGVRNPFSVILFGKCEVGRKVYRESFRSKLYAFVYSMKFSIMASLQNGSLDKGELDAIKARISFCTIIIIIIIIIMNIDETAVSQAIDFRDKFFF